MIRRPFHRRRQPRPPGQAAGFLPDAIEIAPRHLRVGTGWLTSFAILGYPREVYPGFLEPLLTYPGQLDVSLHIEPIPAEVAAPRLRRQLARLESGRRADADTGRLADQHLEAATEDAYELAARLARGEGALFRLGLYLTVHAGSQEQLTAQAAAVRSLAASLLLDAKPSTFRTLQGWTSCLPFAIDALGQRRSFDTAALAAAFPFTSPDLPSPDPTLASAPSGVLYGRNTTSGGLVVWDRFAQDNHNAVILARSGAGKSYLTKLEILRSLYRGIEVAVIDPEDEYHRLADAVGGAHLALGAPGVRLNPFDLPIHPTVDGRWTAPRDTITRRALFLHTVLGVLLGELSAAERAAADRAILATYTAAGITGHDPRTWTRPAPVLGDLAHHLAATGDPAGQHLADRLVPYTEGSFAGLLNGPTTTRPDGHLVVFSLRDLPDEAKSIGTLLTLDAIWRRVTHPVDRRPRLVVVDEAWLLMRQPDGAAFLFRLAKSARKHWAGLTVVTQDAADLLGCELGQAVVANAATQILLRQAPQAIDTITTAFHLSDGERAFLLAADRGQALLLAGGAHRVAFDALASDLEHRLCSTSPAELLADTDDSNTPEPGTGSDDPADTDAFITWATPVREVR